MDVKIEHTAILSVKSHLIFISSWSFIVCTFHASSSSLSPPPFFFLSPHFFHFSHAFISKYIPRKIAKLIK